MYGAFVTAMDKKLRRNRMVNNRAKCSSSEKSLIRLVTPFSGYLLPHFAQVLPKVAQDAAHRVGGIGG